MIQKMTGTEIETASQKDREIQKQTNRQIYRQSEIKKNQRERYMITDQPEVK